MTKTIRYQDLRALLQDLHAAIAAARRSRRPTTLRAEKDSPHANFYLTLRGRTTRYQTDLLNPGQPSSDHVAVAALRCPKSAAYLCDSLLRQSGKCGLGKIMEELSQPESRLKMARWELEHRIPSSPLFQGTGDPAALDRWPEKLEQHAHVLLLLAKNVRYALQLRSQALDSMNPGDLAGAYERVSQAATNLGPSLSGEDLYSSLTWVAAADQLKYSWAAGAWGCVW